MYIKNVVDQSFLKTIFEKAILVGSSGDILNENKGEFINNFPVIIRMNDSRTIGFEKDVGNRTTIRIINFKSIPNIMHSNFAKELLTTKIIILNTPNETDIYKILPLTTIFNHLKIFLFTKNAILLNDKLFEKYTGINRKKSGSWLTTGWFTLFFMINYVKNKHVIGFGGEKNTSLYHYYSNNNLTQDEYYIQNQNSREGHRFITEKQVFNKWIQEFNIIFHKL
jgi:hypothetical protein